MLTIVCNVSLTATLTTSLFLVPQSFGVVEAPLLEFGVGAVVSRGCCETVTAVGTDSEGCAKPMEADPSDCGTMGAIDAESRGWAESRGRGRITAVDSEARRCETIGTEDVEPIGCCGTLVAVDADSGGCDTIGTVSAGSRGCRAIPAVEDVEDGTSPCGSEGK